jgi:glycosyltransferase involved in cell wall biosynthesis
MSGISWRVGLQQRVLPDYRTAFVDALARALPNGLAVLAGAPRPEERIVPAGHLEAARRTEAQNIHLGSGWLALDWQLGWREWLRRESLQAIILEPNPRYISNYLIMDWMRRHRRRVLGWCLGPAKAVSAVRPAMAAYYDSFDALIAYSHSGAEAFYSLGIPAEKVFVAPNAVGSATAERLLAVPDARVQARSALGLDDRPVLLFVGRLQPRKRGDALLHAAAQAAPESQVLIVGDGPDRERLEALAAGIFPAARFLGDLRGDALGKCFLAADLFVMPGTGGLALQEALLYGVPAVAAVADGSQRDLIHPGENGWLLPPGHEAGLATILEDALSNKSRLKDMGLAARRIVLQTATLEHMVEGFLAALHYLEDAGAV